MNRQNGKQIDDELTHIRQSIQDILQTPLGQRVQRRDYGSRLYEFIDKPITPTLLLQISAASVIALKKWEPRVTISRFYVKTSTDAPQKLIAEVEGRINHNNVIFNFDDVLLN